MGEGVGGGGGGLMGEGAGEISSTLPYTALPHDASPEGTSHNKENCAPKPGARVGSFIYEKYKQARMKSHMCHRYSFF